MSKRLHSNLLIVLLHPHVLIIVMYFVLYNSLPSDGSTTEGKKKNILHTAKKSIDA